MESQNTDDAFDPEVKLIPVPPPPAQAGGVGQPTETGPGAETGKPVPKPSRGMRGVLLAALVAVGFGVAGYLIVPQSAQSALRQTSEDLEATRGKLQTALASGKKLAQELGQTKGELTAAQEKVKELTASEKSAKSKVAAAEKFIADLNAKLQGTQKAIEPIRQKLGQVQGQAETSLAEARKAKSQAQGLRGQLAALTKDRDELASARKRMAGERRAMEKELADRKRAHADLVRLLSTIQIGRASNVPACPGRPGEMPITVGEFIGCMGQPTLTFQDGLALRMHWGKVHTASAADGVVTKIDGQPATRALLAKAARAQATPVAPRGAWRVQNGQRLHYADLVVMFGRPEGTAGTGREFKAWWPIGAWARSASATVVDGFVTEFNGGGVEPAQVCGLVRHRAEAYRTANPAGTAAARRYYDRAVGIVGESLQREAALQARDGLHLKEWRMAPFESVGTWIAPTTVPAGATSVRAWVECTWVTDDGTTRRQRRYAVVTLVPRDGQLKQVDFAIFDPRN